LSVTFRYKLKYFGNNFTADYSLRYMLGLTPTWASWYNENTPNIKVEQGWGDEQKHAISPKRCKIGPRLP